MLEELQRLQTHMHVLKKRLAEFERENTSLQDQNAQTDSRYETKLVEKDHLIQQKEQKILELSQALAQEKSNFSALNDDATALADRYGRLEKSCTDLKNRFQEILSERNELRMVKEKLNNDCRIAQQDIQSLQQERDRLLQKNEHAKAKVEAIIQRLTILGTAQDHHSQEIQHLAHPNDAAEEA